jgi:replicative superfamily II helicase
MELCIRSLLQGYRCSVLGPDHGAAFVVLHTCAGPIKALVQERQADWQDRFGRVLGLRVVQLTGDDDTEGLDELETVDVICTTPEKFGVCLSVGPGS